MRHVAVFGGDHRVHTVNSMQHDYGDLGLVVDTYEGTHRDAAKVAEAVMASRLTDVVLLKWAAHAQWAVIMDATRRNPSVRVHRYLQSQNSLRRDMLTVLGLHLRAAPATEPAPPALEESTEPLPPAPEAPIDEAPMVTKPKQKTTLTLATVLEAFTIDKDKEWTTLELMDFLALEKGDDRIYNTIAALTRRGDIMISGGTPRSNVDPTRYKLARVPVVPGITTTETPAPPATGATMYLVLTPADNGEEETFITGHKEEALKKLDENIGARLFKELKVRRVVTIEE